MKINLFTAFIFLTITATAQDTYQTGKHREFTDAAQSIPAPYNYYKKGKKPEKPDYHSLYLTMRDGVKIAVDVYLPKDLKEGEKVPTILHQTRYWRSYQANWPFSMFMGNMFGALNYFVPRIVEQGYAVVNVDCRGSGASFGYRPYPWTMDEVNDGYEICDWIIKQTWSDGNIGAAGESYSGTTAEFLLTTMHPNVKAVVNMYSLFDVYEDNAFPGGLHNEWFTSVWGRANAQLDRNQIPTKNIIARMAINGVEPVKVKGGKKLRREAIASHSRNRNVNDGAMKMTFRDENVMPDMGANFSVDIFSPHTYWQKEDSSGAAIYSYSGWMDGTYQHAAIKRFLTLSNPQNKLILGPWPHGGMFDTSPFSYGDAKFDHLGEILKFFDYHLKGKKNGLYDEARVHYYTIGEEKWKVSDTWPPKGYKRKIYFNENHLATWTKPSVQSGSDVYKIDTNATTGKFTRYESVAGQLRQAQVYPDRKKQDSLLLIYESAPLESNLEITGHPIANIFLSTDAKDLQIIVYLEEVDSAGNVYYITEGMLRAIDRKLSDEKPPYKSAVPYHTYESKDAMPLVPGEVAELVFDFLPISYQLKQGSKLRIAVAGHDKEHFRNIYGKFDCLPTMNIQRNDQYASFVDLPIVED